MIPAEARLIVDNLSNVKTDREIILDAIDCLTRIVSPSMRDRTRVAKATEHLKEKTNV
jgi:hypothetical protein